MKSKNTWMLASKPNNDRGRWSIVFAGETFPTFELAARGAFEFMKPNAPYLYRPVLVDIIPLEEFEEFGAT